MRGETLQLPTLGLGALAAVWTHERPRGTVARATLVIVQTVTGPIFPRRLPSFTLVATIFGLGNNATGRLCLLLCESIL